MTNKDAHTAQYPGQPKGESSKRSSIKEILTNNIGLLIQAGTLVVGVATILTTVNNHIEEVTHKQTQTMAVFFANDIRTRLNLFESYVEETKSKGEQPSLLIVYNIKTLEDQLLELKEWNNAK